MDGAERARGRDIAKRCHLKSGWCSELKCKWREREREREREKLPREQA